MSKALRGILFTLGYVAVGLVAVIAVGCLTYRRQFFHFPEPMLSLLLLGLMGALIYASVQMRGDGCAAAMIVLSLLVHVSLSPALRLTTWRTTPRIRRSEFKMR